MSDEQREKRIEAALAAIKESHLATGWQADEIAERAILAADAAVPVVPLESADVSAQWTLWMDDSGQLRANPISPTEGGGGLVVVPLERAEAAERERDVLRGELSAICREFGRRADALYMDDLDGSDWQEAHRITREALAALPDREEPQ